MSASEDASFSTRPVRAVDFARRSSGSESDPLLFTPDYVCVLSPEALDAESAPGFGARLLEVEPDNDVVIDMSRLFFCDSSGVRMLLAAWRHFVLSGGSLRLRHPPKQLLRVLKICKIQDLFAVILRPD
jgi:anti-anti-sigma factor